MSDRIEPAASPVGWAYFRKQRGSGIYEDMVGATANECAEIVAFNNDTLPDDDPRKITRMHVLILRAAAANLSTQRPGMGDGVRAIANALESYLPPE